MTAEKKSLLTDPCAYDKNPQTSGLNSPKYSEDSDNNPWVAVDGLEAKEK